MAALSMTPDPKVMLKPTPMQVPVVRTYMLGDFMRAFGIDESAIQLAQNGFAAGDIEGILVTGRTQEGQPKERSKLIFHEVLGQNTLLLDAGSSVSITEQVSQRLARCILHSADTMRRQGLTVTYDYLLSTKGLSDFNATLTRYGLEPGKPENLPAGTAFRDVFNVTHKPTGASVTHSTLRRIG